MNEDAVGIIETSPKPPTKQGQIIFGRINDWKKSGRVLGWTAQEVVRQAVAKLDLEAEKIVISGALKELEEKRPPIVDKWLPSNLKVVYELGELGEDGIDILHELAGSYLSGLEKRADPKKGGFINADEHNLANLAMIRLAELHKGGKYETKRLMEARDGIAKVVAVGDEVLKNISYLPEEFGWQALWSEALSDSEKGEETWEKTARALDGCLADEFNPHSRKAYEMFGPLYKAANSQEKIPEWFVPKLADYFIAARHFNESYGYLAPEVFLKVIEKKLEEDEYLYWYPPHVKGLFSQEGTASKMMDIFERYPKNFSEETVLFINSISWVPEGEYLKIMRRYKDFWENSQEVMSLDSCISALNVWERTGVKKERVLEMLGYVLPHMAIRLDEALRYQGNIQPLEKLKTLSKTTGEALSLRELSQTHPFFVWAPLVAEKIIFLSEGGKEEVSFCGNLAADVQARVYRLGSSENVSRIFAAIRTHLHISQVKEAAGLVGEVYRVLDGELDEYIGVKKEELKKLFTDEEVRAKMNLLRNGICKDRQVEKYENRLMAAVNLGKVIAFEEKDVDRRQKAIRSLDTFEKMCSGQFSLEFAGEVISELKKCCDSCPESLFPAIVALRGYILDMGISWPEAASDEEKISWLGSLVDLAEMGGELSARTAFLWRRLARAGNKERAEAVLREGIKDNYKYLEFQTNANKAIRLSNEKISDKKREVESRSMLDLLYRMSQNLSSN